LIGAFLATGCSDTGDVQTLYRTSPYSPMRIHFATFDARESSAYNLTNCQLAAQALNDNVGKLNDGQHPVSFWCERGHPE